MSRNFIVYQSRNRLTGTLTRTLDTKHADCPSEIREAGERYIALCVEHKSIKRFASHYDAGRAIAHVDEWCKKCINMIAKNQKLSAEAIAAYAAAELVGNDRIYAYDKRWTDNVNKSAHVSKTITARQADSNGMFNQPAGVDYNTAQSRNALAKRNRVVQRKANAATKPSAVTTRVAKRKEITKPDPNQLDIVDAKTFRKNVASKAEVTA